MREPILVVGHINPDNDSICSAVGYASLKNQLDAKNHYEPMRLGPLPPESKYVLERFGLSAPAPLKHVHSRVLDAMTPNPLQVAATSTLLIAAKTLRSHDIRTLVVHDNAGQYLGVIDTQTFANLYLAELEALSGATESKSPRLHDPGEPTQAGAAEALEIKIAREHLAHLRQPIANYLTTKVPVLDPESLLTEARERVLASKLRQAVVLNEHGQCVGILTRSDLARMPRRRVILVDHNEVSQAVAGITEAEVLEVVDHHRIGDIQTALPIPFINLPLGSTASIVATEYLRHGLTPAPPIAAVLLSALLTDTVLLKSPTTTARDHEIAAALANQAGLELEAFGRELLEARFAQQDGSVEGVVLTDSKEYSSGDSRFVISQFETIDTQRILAQEQELHTFLEEMVAARGLEFALLLVTDITREGSQFIVAGKPQAVERAFEVSFSAGAPSAWVPGILSRKKQVAPRLL